MLRTRDLILHAKEKGISFTQISEAEAEAYLSKNNNYFKLTSYRKNYSKITDGPRKGQYDRLEFAYLIELARIDVELRHLLLKMCLDIEHFLKVRLIKEVELQMEAGTGEDGYRIVTDYLTDRFTAHFADRALNISHRAGAVARKLRQNQNNPYCEGLMNKYQEDMPIWAFVEVISFGDLEELITFYGKSTGWTIPVDIKSLDRVRQIRNAAAHNNCIINDLNASDRPGKAPLFITQFLSDAGIKRDARSKKLSNRRINQLVHLLYVYDCVVTSENTRAMRLAEMRELLDRRMLQHRAYFRQNAVITSAYQFFHQIIDRLSDCR